MKYVVATFAALIVVVGVGYFSKEIWTTLSTKKAEKVQSKLEIELFPLILKSQPKENILARPMWAEETLTTLKIYCEYFGDKSADEREKVRSEMVLIVKSWAEAQKKKYNFIYVIFTDEIMNPDRK